jgi:hypothetical protein
MEASRRPDGSLTHGASSETTMNSGLGAIAVYLRRHGLGNRRDLLPKEAKAPQKAFKTYEPGWT